jgi:predicted metal-binding membrane protein
VSASSLPDRLAVGLQWRPEWRVAAVAAAAWPALIAGGGMDHAQLEPDHSPLAVAAAGLPGWGLMVLAMMVPVTLPAVRHVGLNSMRRRRQRAMAVYTAIYVGVWLLFGVSALGLAHLATDHAGLSDDALLALALAAAAGWQLTRAKRRALFACGRTVPLPPLGRRADAACARFALLHAWRCMRSCWAIMAVMAAVGHAGLGWMAALTALVVAEELTVRGRRLTRPAAVALAGAAVAVALGAAGHP